jgi:hypothetical protein
MVGTLRPVYLLESALLNAAGSSVEVLHGPAPVAQNLDFAPDRLGFPLPAPRLPTERFDRKLQRSVEAQSLRLLHCAARLAPALGALGLAPERVGLTAAIPEVDAPSPGWEAVDAMRRQPAQWLAQWFANTPPLHSLTLLNSSSMAHVAEALACHGPMAGYCGQESAGLDALLEAGNYIAEGLADAVLVVSSSPNITPALFLREEGLEKGTMPFVPGEGAAACLLAAAPAKGDKCNVRIAGYGRGYLINPVQSDTRTLDILMRVLNQVLSPEHLSLSDLSAVLSDPDDEILRAVLDNCPVRAGCRPLVGALGASSLITDLAYALAEPEFVALERPAYLLLLSCSYTGHVSALLLAVEPARSVP